MMQSMLISAIRHHQGWLCYLQVILSHHTEKLVHLLRAHFDVIIHQEEIIIFLHELWMAMDIMIGHVHLVTRLATDEIRVITELVIRAVIDKQVQVEVSITF